MVSQCEGNYEIISYMPKRKLPIVLRWKKMVGAARRRLLRQ
jgi:hypothetical protein